jgi:hypothetical protein
MNSEETTEDPIQALCLAELAGWRGRRLLYVDVCEEYRRINETRASTFIFNIKDGIVSISDKPANLQVQSGWYDRVMLYLNFIQSVVITYQLDFETSFAFDVPDGGMASDNAPVFVFQKPIGSDTVLFPDIDFLLGQFHTYPDVTDQDSYDEKETSAIFVGSTTGANITEDVARYLRSPRLKAANYFFDHPLVQFFLPSIVQCESDEARQLLEQMGFGSGKKISWRAQLKHKFLISIDGNGATCSRVAIALKSNSVLLKYNSPHLLYYFHHMIPWQHFIPVAQDGDIERVVQMELEDPGLFRNIAHQGRMFAEKYLTKAAVGRYAAELIRFHAGSFQPNGLSRSRSIPRVGEGSDICGTNGAAYTVGFEVMGHFQNQGDVVTQGGTWLGQTGSGCAIEGVMLTSMIDIPGLTYQGLLEDGVMTPPVRWSEFCGSRGQNTPLLGFRINLDDAARGRVISQCSATFIDGSVAGPAPAGEICQSEVPVPLESLRIELYYRDKPQS